MPGSGFQLGPTLSEAQQADVDFGFRIAKEISRLEIGQTVLVKDGTVLAVEAFEGTDKCLARGGELAGKEGGAVAVKVPRKTMTCASTSPASAPQTFEACAAAPISVLAFEAGRSLLLEQDTCARLASKNKLSVTTVG